MSQDRQIKKVKKYRTLKVVFYFLGLPLFILAVLLTSIRFIGRDPFIGEPSLTSSLGFLTDHEALITSPALFGIWLAVGVWFIISVFHLIVNKAVKSRRVRMFSVLAFTLVLMLGGTLLMDTIFDAKIDAMRAEHLDEYGDPDGVDIPDYRTQLSYYRTVSSNAKNNKNETRKLIDKVLMLEKVYNVEYYGINKSGVAGNIANKPATYANVIDDEGNIGVDISYVRGEDGKLDLSFTGDNDASNDTALIRLEPNSGGYLEINGKVYTNYFYCKRTLTTGEDIYVWYPLPLMPTTFDWDPAKGDGKSKPTDGIYGEALYNRSGTISDGWVFSVQNVLEILEDYYEAQEYIQTNDASGEIFESIFDDAYQNYLAYYNGEIPDPETGEYVDEWTMAHFKQQADYEERFSITNGELNALVAKVGALLGKNSLFDFLFGSIEDVGELVGSFVANIGDIIKPLLENLSKGYKLADMLAGFGVSGAEDTIKTVFSYLTDDPIYDIYLTLAYDSTDAFGTFRDHLYLAVINHDPAKGDTLSEDEVLIDIDFSDAIIDEEGADYAFDFDHLSVFLNNTLNYLIGTKLNLNLSDGILNTILGLFLKDMKFNGLDYKGLDISGIKIPLIEVRTVGESKQWVFNVDINGILSDLLEGFYNYQSPLIKPVWEFYDWQDYSMIPNAQQREMLVRAQEMYKQYERAEYEATVYGTMIGSTLIGDSLGTGAYTSDFGLTDLQSVRQLKADLAYKPVYYPLFAFRDMLLMFSGIVMIFYFLSFVAAEKEEKYGRGELIPKRSDLTEYDYMGEEPDEHVVIHEKVVEQVLPETEASPVTDIEREATGAPPPEDVRRTPKKPSAKNKRKGVK